MKDGYPVYGANGVIGFFDSYNHEHETILIGCRGTCGNICVCEPHSYVTGNAMCLDELDSNVDLHYLECYLRSFDFGKVISGTSQPQITRQGLSKVWVPLASHEVQVGIADTFAAVSNLENQCQKQLSELDNLVKSRFTEMFGDIKTTYELQELIIPKTKISYGIVQPGSEGTGEMGVLRPVDIIGGRLNLDNVKRIARSIGDSFKRTELIGDEILTVVRGATGQTVRSTPETLGMNVTRGIAVIRYDASSVDPEYLVAYMNSDDGRRYIFEHTQGATLKQINIADLKVMPIPRAPLELQRQFADFVAQVDKLRFACVVRCLRKEVPQVGRL